MKSKILLSLAFAVVFVLGVMTGVSVSMRWGKEMVERRAWQDHARKNFQKMADELELTAEQREKIRPMIIAAFQAQRRNFSEIRREFRKLDDQIQRELSEPQRARFKEFREKMDKRWGPGERDGKRPGPREDGPPPPPPPGK